MVFTLEPIMPDINMAMLTFFAWFLPLLFSMFYFQFVCLCGYYPYNRRLKLISRFTVLPNDSDLGKSIIVLFLGFYFCFIFMSPKLSHFSFCFLTVNPCVL